MVGYILALFLNLYFSFHFKVSVLLFLIPIVQPLVVGDSNNVHSASSTWHFVMFAPSLILEHCDDVTRTKDFVLISLCRD